MPDDIVKEEASSITTLPQPTKETDPRQRSINVTDMFLTRYTLPWSRPPSWPAEAWRKWVANQPVASSCKESLISTLLSLDWKIVARNPQYREELAPVARYYTKLLDRGGYYLGTDFTVLTEWVMGDLLDLPFGGALEVGRKNDAPDGRVKWLRPIDAGTLFPTLNDEFPVIQYYMGYDAVVFPAHAIARTFMSPSPSIYREGWGIAPPEKFYFALDMLNRGDKYYANLLLDVPPVGVLDLGDMEKDSAVEWVNAFKEFMNGVTSSFKIPVLYEHTKPVEFISFGKAPNDIMYDSITERYITLLCAGYGLSPSDIGIASQGRSGSSLAGTIRQERKSRITGRAKVKAKMEYLWDAILPDSLMFKYVDFDDESTLAKGRSRLASATAFNMYKQMGTFSAQEIRTQTLQDGLVDISVPEEIPPDAVAAPTTKTPERPGSVGSPSAASAGGEGDIRTITSRSKFTDFRVKKIVDTVSSLCAAKLMETLASVSEDEMVLMKQYVQDDIMSGSDELGLSSILSDSLLKVKSPLKIQLPDADNYLRGMCMFDANPDDLADVDFKSYAKQLEQTISSGMVDFIGRAALVTLSEVEAECIFDNVDSVDYDYIQQETQDRVLASLSDFTSAYVEAEAEKIVEQIKSEVEKKWQQ